MCTEDRNEETIFDAVVRLSSHAERDTYLSEACAGDRKLRAAVEELLKHHDVGSFLDVAPVDSAVALDDSPVSEGPGTVIGRYRLLEKIGEGGMAVVYMAEQTEPIRRKVALKVIKLGMDTRQVIARFEAERQALAMMDHPNIARVLDAGATETGRPYFAMELVHGVSITEYCDKNSLRTKERLALFLQLCDAVQHAHQRGIIHRDIKPSNVMVTQRDGVPVPKVIDFGIAKATNQKLTEKTLFTRYAHIIGTPAYMSPEQAELNATEVDIRTDVYSLAVLLYELLTAATPFGEERLREAGYVQMQQIVCAEEPTRPSSRIQTSDAAAAAVAARRGTTPTLLRKLLRHDLDWIVMKGLEKDRQRRYATAGELAADVRRHLNHQPVRAAAPSVSYRLSKFARRNRLAVAMVALVTGATLMGATVAKLGIWISPGSMGKPQHATGMSQRHVWDAPAGASLTGRISPDGRYLTYVDWNAGNLAAYDLVEDRHWHVTDNTDTTWETIDGWNSDSAVSPDGTQGAYSWYKQEGRGYCELRVIDLDGSNVRVLYSDTAVPWLLTYAWSPDGQGILACYWHPERDAAGKRTGNRFAEGSFSLVSATDGSVRILKKWSGDRRPMTAGFSPDGRYVAYDFVQDVNSPQHDILLIDLEQGQETFVIEHPADDQLLGWTADGQRIVFVSDRSARRGLWMIDVAQGAPLGLPSLLKGEFDGGPIGFTSDGSYYYSVNTTASNVYLASIDPTGADFEGHHRLASSRFVGSTYSGDFSPDGGFVAYRTDRVETDRWVFVIYSLETSEERVVRPSPAFGVRTKMRGPWWSPDGRSLIVCGMIDDILFQLYTIDVQTGATSLVPGSGRGGLRRVAWSPDAQSIYVRHLTNINRLDLATGEQTELYQVQSDAVGIDISPDGSLLAFYMGLQSLAVMPVEGGEPRKVVQFEPSQLTSHAFVTWTPDGENLLYSKKVSEETSELWQVHVPTGAERQITTVNGELLRAEVHPDGRQIAFTVQQAGSQLWVVENFLPP